MSCKPTFTVPALPVLHTKLLSTHQVLCVGFVSYQVLCTYLIWPHQLLCTSEVLYVHTRGVVLHSKCCKSVPLKTPSDPLYQMLCMSFIFMQAHRVHGCHAAHSPGKVVPSTILTLRFISKYLSICESCSSDANVLTTCSWNKAIHKKLKLWWDPVS